MILKLIHGIIYFIEKLEGDILRKLSIILCLVWMELIFYNSSRTATVSGSISYSVVNSIRNDKHALQGKNKSTKVIASVLPNSLRDQKIDLIIRKNAHAFEYCVLALFVANSIFLFGVKGRNALTSIMFICLLYAVTDEFHQLFVQGRGSLVSDVLIDFGGSLIGLGLFYLVYYKIYAMNRIKQIPR